MTADHVARIRRVAQGVILLQQLLVLDKETTAALKELLGRHGGCDLRDLGPVRLHWFGNCGGKLLDGVVRR